MFVKNQEQLDQWKEGQALFLEFLKSLKFNAEELSKKIAINYADSQSPEALKAYMQSKGRMGMLMDLIELDFELVESVEHQERELKTSYGK